MTTARVDKLAQELIEAELAAANERFPLFRSPHEGYAVLLEEIEELGDDYGRMRRWMDHVWSFCKQNVDLTMTIDAMMLDADSMVLEAVQVAAMVRKLRMSQERKWGDADAQQG